MSWGAEARLRHRKGGGSRDLSISLRTGASGPPLRLRSLSEASGRSSRRLVPQFPHPRSGAGPSRVTHSSGGGLTLWESFSKHVALHEIALTVIPSAVTIGVGGVCLFGFTFVLPPPLVNLLNLKNKP